MRNWKRLGPHGEFEDMKNLFVEMRENSDIYIYKILQGVYIRVMRDYGNI